MRPRVLKYEQIMKKCIEYTSFSRTRKLTSEIVFGRGSLFCEDWLEILSKNKYSNHFLITDKTVYSLYINDFVSFLSKHKIDIKVFKVPVGEKSKSMIFYEKISANILKNGMDERSYIIGFGGGVVNNIAGFLASTLYRGVRLIQIPTTLLAQVDAAIDFKQAINGQDGKNHIGSYYPADVIIVDPNLLQTLPDRHLRNGMAESIKHALTQDKGFYTYLQSNKKKVNNKHFLDEVISSTINLKVPLVNDSLNPQYSEMLPQYGHAVGHAIEQVSHYKLLHGEAISIGMCVMAEIAFLLNICNKKIVDGHYEILSKYGLPVVIPNYIDDYKILNALKKDKHFFKGSIGSVFVSNFGSVMNYNTNSCLFTIKRHVVNLALKINRKRSFGK